MTYIDQCFWSYPTTSTVQAGQVLPFQVIVPPAGGLAQLPIMASSATWMITGDSGPLVPGVDYHILAGGLDSTTLSIVFKPPATATTVSVVPNVSLFYAGAQQPETSDFTAQPFTLQPVTSEAVTTAIEQIQSSLSLVTDNAIVEPAAVAGLRIVPTSVVAVPQVVTSLLHELPEVDIRGAIPLDSLVQAVLSPVSAAFGRTAPGSKWSGSGATMDVASLLGSLVTIPVAIDVVGERLTKTLTPIGAPQVPIISASPDGMDLTGLVPIGSWPARFDVVNVTWTVTEGFGATSVYSDLSPGVDLLKSLLLRPEIVHMSPATAMAPTPVVVTATIEVDIDVAATSTPLAFDLSLTLQRLPLPLPQIAAVFRHAFDDVDNFDDQRVFLTCDAATASFVSSVGDCIDLVSSLATVLNRVVTLVPALTEDWAEFVQLAGAFGLLAEQVSRASLNAETGSQPGYVAFSPSLNDQSYAAIDLADTFWNNCISAVIAIGQTPEDGFVLSDSDGSSFIAFAGPSPSSVLPNLNASNFRDVAMIPPGTAYSNYETGKNLNDILEVLGYGAPPS